MSAQHVYTLKHPITRRFRQADGSERDEMIVELTIRRPTAKDVRAANRVPDDFGKAVLLAARLTSVDEATIENLDMEDFTEVSQVIEGFIPDGRATGTTS